MSEIFLPLFKTTLTTNISSGVRPVVFSVAATQAALGVAGATFSALIYDFGSDASPTHAEAFKVTSGGGTLTWTATNEAEWAATTHLSGSQVIVTALTPRSMQQPLVDHVTPETTPDPHPGYMRAAAFTAKGDALIGTANGTFTHEAIGADGTTIIADSSQITGRRWGNAALTFLQHMGDLIIGGTLGVAQRLGIGTAGQTITVLANAPLVNDPSTLPTCSDGPIGGTLGNAVTYYFAYAWSNAAPPDGGITLPSPTASFLVTSNGSVNVQAPAAPTVNLTLLVYVGTLAGTLYLSTSTLPDASVSSPNTVVISVLPSPTQPVVNVTNTTGGTTLGWTTLTGTGTVTSIAQTVPSEFSISGSPITGAGVLAISKLVQPANQVWAGPVSGVPAQPAFRLLIPTDLPIQLEHEEFLPLSADTQLTLEHTPLVVLTVSRGGLIQSVSDNNYSITGPSLFFAAPFSGSERVIVAYSHGIDQSLLVAPGRQSVALPVTRKPWREVVLIQDAAITIRTQSLLGVPGVQLTNLPIQRPIHTAADAQGSALPNGMP